MFRAHRQYHFVGACFPFADFDSLIFCSQMCRGLRKFLLESETGGFFVEYVDSRGMRIRYTWDILAQLIAAKLIEKGYANVHRGFDDIVLAMLCLSYWDDDNLHLPSDCRQKVLTLIHLLSFASKSISAQPAAEEGQGAQPAAEEGEDAQPAAEEGEDAQPAAEEGEDAQPAAEEGEDAQPAAKRFLS